MSDSAKSRIAAQRRRDENRKLGLCHCGRPRRPGMASTGRAWKLCEVCHDLSSTTRRRSIAADEAAPAPSEDQIKAYREKRFLSFVRLTTAHDPALLAEWDAFCAIYNMPVAEAIEAAMEMLIAVTEAAEREAVAVDDDNSMYELKRA